eukprot:jgi/Mesvir1/23679/Mv18635-RA.1
MSVASWSRALAEDARQSFSSEGQATFQWRQVIAAAAGLGMVAGSVGATSVMDSAASPCAGTPAAGDVRQGRPKEVVLYQYAPCPFCNKVRAFLDYHRIPYRAVEVDPLTKKEIKWSEYKKVPIVVVDGEQINDSTNFMNVMHARMAADKGHRPLGDEGQKNVEWQQWVDKHVVHLLSPNIYRTPAEALQAFEYITVVGNFSSYERFMAKYSGAAIMYIVGKKLKKEHNIVDERQALYDALDKWVAAVGDNRKFLGGSAPNRADLALFGILRAIAGLQTWDDMMANTKIGTWYHHMEAALGPSMQVAAEPPSG